jgi:hypothetical protein
VKGQINIPAALTAGKISWSPVDSMRSGRGGEVKIPCPCRESNPGRPAHNHFIF